MASNLCVRVPASGKAAYVGLIASMTLCGMRATVYDKREGGGALVVFAEAACAGSVEKSLAELSAILPYGSKVETLDE